MPAGQATLAYVFQLALNHYSLRTGASVTLAKTQFERARAAVIGEASPPNKPTLCVPSVPRIPNTRLSGVGTGSLLQRQKTGTAGQNLNPFLAVSPVYTPMPVSPPHHSTMRPNAQPLVDSPTLHVPLNQFVRYNGLAICNNHLPVRNHSSRIRNSNPAIYNNNPPT